VGWKSAKPHDCQTLPQSMPRSPREMCLSACHFMLAKRCEPTDSIDFFILDRLN
jgi:hypothetical protein